MHFVNDSIFNLRRCRKSHFGNRLESSRADFSIIVMSPILPSRQNNGGNDLVHLQLGFLVAQMELVIGYRANSVLGHQFHLRPVGQKARRSVGRRTGVGDVSTQSSAILYRLGSCHPTRSNHQWEFFLNQRQNAKERGAHDNTLGELLASGEARTFLTRQIASVDVVKDIEKKESAPVSSPFAAGRQPDGSKAVASPVSPAPVQFVPPRSGTLTLQKGTAVDLRLREFIDGGAPSADFGVFITASTVDDIAAGGTIIPSGTAVTLFAINRPGAGGREIRCLLSGMFPGGKTYHPDGSTSSGGKDAMLGSLFAPPSDNLPRILRDVPLRIAVASVVEFKVISPITLREVK